MAYTSARSSSDCPRACSGDMYAGVPSTTPCAVRSDPLETAASPGASRRLGGASPASSSFARPQSMTMVSPKPPTMTFEGFRSRWMTRWLCA